MGHQLHRLAIFFAFALACLGQVSSSPTPAELSTETFYRRQEQGSPVSGQTVQTIQTDAGPVIETCTITLTPVTGPNGEPLVQVVRQCTVTAASQSASSSSTASTFTSSPPPSTTTESTSTTTSVSSSAPAVVFSSVSLSLTTLTTSLSPSSSTPTPSSSVTPNPGASIVGFSSVPFPTTTLATSSSDSGTSAAAENATAAASSSAAAAFQIPGKKISVLPIGLGIFAGISVIALIVVGLVTYERTKYRKIFRQRKLAEQGAGPGYGGLA